MNGSAPPTSSFASRTARTSYTSRDGLGKQRRPDDRSSGRRDDVVRRCAALTRRTTRGAFTAFTKQDGLRSITSDRSTRTATASWIGTYDGAWRGSRAALHALHHARRIVRRSARSDSGRRARLALDEQQSRHLSRQGAAGCRGHGVERLSAGQLNFIDDIS